MFLMGATANIDSDTACDAWIIDHCKNLVNTFNDVSDRIDTGYTHVTDCIVEEAGG